MFLLDILYIRLYFIPVLSLPKWDSGLYSSRVTWSPFSPALMKAAGVSERKRRTHPRKRSGRNRSEEKKKEGICEYKKESEMFSGDARALSSLPAPTTEWPD